MSSLAGEMSGLNKQQFISICKSKFPDEAAFMRQMNALTAHAEMQIREVQDKLKPGQALGIAYPVEVHNGPVH
jgi:hypothetical protein